MNKKLWIPLLAFVAVFAVADYYLDYLWKLVFIGLIYASLPCAVLGSILLFRAWRMDGKLRTWLPVPGAMAGLAVLALVTMTSNQYLHAGDVEEAQAYAARITPLLEDYKETHGTYAATLDALPGIPPLPRLLRKPGSYQSDGRDYWFSFPQPGSLMDEWYYSCRNRQWVVGD